MSSLRDKSQHYCYPYLRVITSFLCTTTHLGPVPSTQLLNIYTSNTLDISFFALQILFQFSIIGEGLFFGFLFQALLVEDFVLFLG
jgi:hypothetical protein